MPSNAREVAMRASASITAFKRLSWAETPALERLCPEPGPDVRHVDTDKPFFEMRNEQASAVPTEVSFGPFRLFPTQFLLLEGDRAVPLGSRALEILIVLLECPGKLVSKQELMARVWPNVFVEPANLTVHISALRRMLRDGQGGNRFIINIPGRGYSFVASVAVAGRVEPLKMRTGPYSVSNPERRCRAARTVNIGAHERTTLAPARGEQHLAAE
jgi:DNA-binding winged helix-turn-helix (wHTH) protein